MADHRDHPRPRAGDPATGHPRPPAVLARRRRRPASPNWAPRSIVHPRTRPPPGPSRPRRIAARDRRLRTTPSTTCRAPRPAHAPPRSSPATHAAGRTVPRRAGRLAGGAALAVRAEGARPAGAGGQCRRLLERYGVDEKPTASDDGIVVRLPTPKTVPPGEPTFVFDPDEIEPLVTGEVGGSALFASRFRLRGAPCCCPAAIRQSAPPGISVSAPRNCSTWPQVSGFPDRAGDRAECLQDVYDVPTLTELMARIAQRQVCSRSRRRRRRRSRPRCCSATSGRSCTRATARWRNCHRRSLDSTLLAELLGRVELRELLDQVIAATARQLQHLSEGPPGPRRRRVADLLRLLGPLTEEEIAQLHPRRTWVAWLDGLHAAKRVLPVSYAGQSWWVGIEGHRPVARRRRGRRSGRGARRVHRAVPDPWASCWAAMRAPAGPRTTSQAAARFGLGLRVAVTCWAASRSTAGWCAGEFVDLPRVVSSGATPRCSASCGDAHWPRCARRWSRSAPRLRPFPAGLAADRQLRGHRRGRTGAVIDQLAGYPVPASAVEPLVSGCGWRPPARDARRAAGLRRGHLVGARSISGSDGWIAFHHADTAPLTLAPPAEIEFTDTHRAILDVLGRPVTPRRVLLPPAGRRRRRHRESRAVGTDLGRLGHRRHLRPGARAGPAGVVRGAARPPLRAPAAPPPRLSRYSVAHAQARPADPTVAGGGRHCPRRNLIRLCGPTSAPNCC